MASVRGDSVRTAAQAGVVALLVYLNLAALGLRDTFDVLTATVFLQLRPLHVLTTAVSGTVLHAVTWLVVWLLVGSVLIRIPVPQQGARAARYVAFALMSFPVSFVGGWLLFTEAGQGVESFATVMTAAALVFFCWPLGVSCYVWSQWRRDIVREE